MIYVPTILYQKGDQYITGRSSAASNEKMADGARRDKSFFITGKS